MNNLWEFIKNNILSLITVIIGISVIVLNNIGILGMDSISKFTLILVCFLATTGIVDTQRRFQRIENRLEDYNQRVISDFDLLSTKKVNVNEHQKELEKLIKNAKESIVWVTPEKRSSTSAESKRKYEKCLAKVVKRGDITFTWITVFENEPARQERAKKLLKKYGDNPKLNIYKIEGNNKSPMFTFIIFDNKIILTRAPFIPGSVSDYLESYSPTFIELFRNVYLHILTKEVERIDKNSISKLY